jgi:serine protease Do
LASRLGYRTEEGLVITEVTKYSEASRKGIQRGDIIIEVNQTKMEAVRDLENILKKAKAGDAIMLLMRREGNGRSQDYIVTLSIPE